MIFQNHIFYNSEYRLHIFTIIHEIVFHGGGGYDYDTVYNMPIWLRKFTFQQISDFKKREQDEYNKAMSKNKGNTSANIGNPNMPESLKNALKNSKLSPTYNKGIPKK